ncbi:MAG: zinc-ribbon domain-containing protein, partial [Thiohalocapsa sp.]
MLIVCPSCATSYQIDAGSVGATGRMVRCARCRATWFAGPAQAESPVDAFVDSLIAEAEAEHGPSPATAMHTVAAENFGGKDDHEHQDQPVPVDEAAAQRFASVDAAAQAIVEAAEAAPVTVADSPSLVPPIEHMPLPESVAPAEPEPADSESFVARRRRLQGKREKSRRTSRWTAIVLVLFAFNVAVIGARNEVVRFLPQTASLFAAIGLPVNLRQLDFEDVRITRETENGATILLVDGKVVSKAKKPLEVPRLRFAARNAAGQEIYTWTARPERSILPPGESMEFHTSLAKPPADANDVMVRFFTA